MILYNSENSIRDIGPFCRPLFYQSGVLKYTSSLLHSSELKMRLGCQILLKSPPPLNLLTGSAPGWHRISKASTWETNLAIFWLATWNGIRVMKLWSGLLSYTEKSCTFNPEVPNLFAIAGRTTFIFMNYDPQFSSLFLFCFHCFCSASKRWSKPTSTRVWPSFY